MASLRLTKIIPIKLLRLNLDNIQSIKVRLSNHATFTSLQWDIKGDQNISWKNLFSEITSFNEYNFIHLNHTNPALIKDSNAHQQIINAGFNIAQPKQVIAF